MFKQARHQDVAAGGTKNQKGGHIFKIQYWMYAPTGGPNLKWGAPISNGGPGTTGPPVGDGPVFKTLIKNDTKLFCGVTFTLIFLKQRKVHKRFRNLPMDSIMSQDHGLSEQATFSEKTTK